jgi:membrane protein
MKAMFDALNVAYGLKEERSFFVLNGVALCFTLGFMILTAIAAALLVVLPPLLERFFGGELLSTLLSLARWPALFIALSLGIALLYWLGPSPQDRKWRWLTPGSIIAALLWCMVSAGFSYYAANFGSYDATYGSLGAAIGLMTWMWLSITVILLGAELNAQIDKSTEVKKKDPV